MIIWGFNIQHFQRKIPIYKKYSWKQSKVISRHLQKKKKKKYTLESDSVTFLSNELSES